MRKRSLLFLLLVFLLAWPQPAQAAFSYFPPTPAGAIGYARPKIGIRVIMAQGLTVEEATLTLNGKTHPLTRDQEGFFYQPPTPLGAGSYQARLFLKVAGYQPVVQEWSFTVAEGAVGAYPAPTPEQNLVRSLVNAHRKAAGLWPIPFNGALALAAQAHADYFLLNPSSGLAGHRQEVGKPGFVGEQVYDRAAYFDYFGFGASENMHFRASHQAAVDDWLHSVYHRFPILSPDADALGYGFASSGSRYVNVLNVGLGNRAALGAPVVYPAPGQPGVPTRWAGREEPNPYRLFPGAQAAGYPITLQYGGVVEALTVEQATLTDAAGQPVDFWLLTPEIDEYLRGEVALLPKAELKPASRYYVQISGRVTFQGRPSLRFNQSWWFDTEGAPEAPLLYPGLTVYLDGEPLTFDVPVALQAGRTLVPYRGLLEALGATVTWNESLEEITAELAGASLWLKVNNKRALVGHAEVALDVTPQIVEGRTLVPLRFVAEALGLRVHYSGSEIHLFSPLTS